MYYFYYFQDTQTNLYYGGITDNVLRRQTQHQKDLNKNLKSNKKLWHLYQDKIQLIVLWSFETKSQACVYEKQWIINNYLNPLCLNCSVSNSEYDYNEHQNLCEAGGGFKAKVRYALEVTCSKKIYIFKSGAKAAQFTQVAQEKVPHSCKTSQPINGSGRWLFSDVSIDDLKAKFNNLTQYEIKGRCNRLFILVNKITKKQSQVFNSICEPQKHGYKISLGNLSNCLLGKRRTVNGYYVLQAL